MLVTLSPSRWLKTIFSSKMVVSPARNPARARWRQAEARRRNGSPQSRGLRRATRHHYYALIAPALVNKRGPNLAIKSDISSRLNQTCAEIRMPLLHERAEFAARVAACAACGQTAGSLLRPSRHGDLGQLVLLHPGAWSRSAKTGAAASLAWACATPPLHSVGGNTRLTRPTSRAAGKEAGSPSSSASAARW